MSKAFYYFSKALYSLGRPFFPTKVLGKENIMVSGKCIYAGNHLSAVDIPLSQVHMKGFRHYIGKKEYAEKKFSRFCLSHFGVIFIDREKPELSVMREIFKVLEDGQIYIFPEGTRNHGDEKTMLELKGGLAIFAAKSGAPVIPVLTYRKPRIFRKNYLYFGEPIDICDVKGRIPNAQDTDRLTKRYQYEFARCRIILDDIVKNKRWKKKNKLADGEKCPSLIAWEAENKLEEAEKSCE